MNSSQSLYARYIQERLGDHIIETPLGFATYRFPDEKTVYIVDIYVPPEHRKHGVTRDILAVIMGIAKQKGCTKLIGSVVPSTKGSTESLKFLLAHGMTLDSCAVDFILFSKVIE